MAGSTSLRITATPNHGDRTYLKLGLFLGTDFQDTYEFGVTALYEATEMNRLGAEWNTMLDGRDSRST